jgi:hypothetical protein
LPDFSFGSTGVERSVGDVDTGVVAVAGKVNPAELRQWLKRKTMKDVKIVCPDPPVENRNQVLTPRLLGQNEERYCDVLGFTNECIHWKNGKKDHVYFVLSR